MGRRSRLPALVRMARRPASEVFARPGLAERVLAAAGSGTAAAPPGPRREELLALVSSAGAPAAAR